MIRDENGEEGEIYWEALSFLDNKGRLWRRKQSTCEEIPNIFDGRKSSSIATEATLTPATLDEANSNADEDMDFFVANDCTSDTYSFYKDLNFFEDVPVDGSVDGN